MRARRPVRPPGMGVKNIENKRVRNRRFKIKKMMAQPKNIEVKLVRMVKVKNGRVFHRIVVRRSTIYPGSRRKNYY